MFCIVDMLSWGAISLPEVSERCIGYGQLSIFLIQLPWGVIKVNLGQFGHLCSGS